MEKAFAKKRTRPVPLSPRLTSIVELAGCGETVCDVGCDHAHVPIRLLQEGRFQCAIGMDVIEGPLGKAKGNISLYGLSDRIELRLSDGLDSFYPGEADTLVVTGMGGSLMRDILLREPEKTRSFSALVAGPQSDPDRVREALRLLDFVIEEERLIYGDGKYYNVIRAVPGSQPSPEYFQIFGEEIPEEICMKAADLFGPVLLQRKDPTLYEYLVRKTATLEKILKEVRLAMSRQKTDPADGLETAEGREPGSLIERHREKEKELAGNLEIFKAGLSVYRSPASDC